MSFLRFYLHTLIVLMRVQLILFAEFELLRQDRNHTITSCCDFCCSSVPLQLAYTISVHLDDNEGALQHPELNIPSSGAIPRSVETFKIHLVCNGNVTAEVPVGIHLHVEGPPKQNDTKLIIKRNKICIKGECSFLHVFRRIGLVFHLGAIGGRYRVLSVCMSLSMNANCCRFSWRSFGWLDERGDVRGLFTLH